MTYHSWFDAYAWSTGDLINQLRRIYARTMHAPDPERFGEEREVILATCRECNEALARLADLLDPIVPSLPRKEKA